MITSKNGVSRIIAPESNTKRFIIKQNEDINIAITRLQHKIGEQSTRPPPHQTNIEGAIRVILAVSDTSRKENNTGGCIATRKIAQVIMVILI